MSDPSTGVGSDEQFEYWLAHMDDALDEFRTRLPVAVREQLDGSPASLAVLEAWLLERYTTARAITSDAELANLDGSARYVGEVFRTALGGRWRIRLDDPKYAFHGLPELSFLDKRDTPVAPMTLVTASLDRRTGKFLLQVFQGTKDLVDRHRSRR